MFLRLWTYGLPAQYPMVMPQTLGFLKQDISFDSPQISLLNQQVDTIPKYSQALIFFILLGAKITVVNAWKCPG